MIKTKIMIKENELRVGNWVNDELGEPVVVEFIKGDIYSHSPIRITPEILDRCGFDNNKRLNDFHFIVNQQLVVYGSEHDYNGLYIGEVKHIHQLQNLYFRTHRNRTRNKSL